MLPGGLRKSKFLCASREASRGHEPVATLGRPAGAPWVRSCPLVRHRRRDRARSRDLGVGTSARFRPLTNDLDFSAILAAGVAEGPSVVQIRTQDLLSDAAVTIVAKALEAHRDDIERGALLSIDDAGTRVRVLPLRRSGGLL